MRSWQHKSHWLLVSVSFKDNFISRQIFIYCWTRGSRQSNLCLHCLFCTSNPFDLESSDTNIFVCFKSPAMTFFLFHLASSVCRHNTMLFSFSFVYLEYDNFCILRVLWSQRRIPAVRGTYVYALCLSLLLSWLVLRCSILNDHRVI